MKEKIQKFLQLLLTLTKEEADQVEEILNWDSETKAAFLLAKQLFEEED